MTEAGRAKSRILFPYVGDTIGGSHFSSSLLIQALQQSEEFEPVVALHQMDGPLLPWLQARGIQPIHIPLHRFVSGNPKHPLRQLLTWLRITLPLSRELKKLNVQIVHTNDLRMHFSWLWAAKLAGVLHVWHKRNRRNEGRFWGTIMRLPDQVLGVSEYTLGGFRKWLSPERAVAIDNPFVLPPNEKLAGARERILEVLGATQDERIIITIGTVSRSKRSEFFIRVCAEIHAKSRHACRFVILGRTNGKEAELQALAESLGIADRLLVAGFRNDVEDWIAGADLLISPSVDEPLGRSIIEAMLLGTAVIASDSGGNREIITDAALGTLVPLDDLQGFTDSAVNLLDSSEMLDSMTTAARHYSRNRFSLETHAAAVMQIYRSMQKR